MDVKPDYQTLWYDHCWPKIEPVLASWPGGNIQMTTDIQTSNACGMAAKINDAHGHMIIAPVIDHMDGKPGEAGPYKGNQRSSYDQIVADGNELWLYTSCDSWGCNARDHSGWASYAIDASASQNRAMGWLCFIYGATGELYWQVDATLDNAWNDGKQWINGGMVMEICFILEFPLGQRVMDNHCSEERIPYRLSLSGSS